MIAEASDSNTKHGGNFSIEDKQGSSTTFDKHGDDDYGRATSLECRLLSSLLDSGDQKITGYDESYLLLDGSGSSVSDEYAKLAKLIETGGLDGTVTLAGFASGENTLEKFEFGDTMDTGRAKALLLAVSLHKAKQEGSDGVSWQDIHDALAKGGVTTVPDALMGMRGLQDEEGLACALAWLKKIEERPDFDPTDGVKRQFLVATDEPDFNPGILEDLQTKATEMNFSVKVQYSFTNGAESTIHGWKGDSYVIVDVMALDVDMVMADKYDPGGNRTNQLDWYMASTDQQSKVESW